MTSTIQFNNYYVQKFNFEHFIIDPSEEDEGQLALSVDFDILEHSQQSNRYLIELFITCGSTNDEERDFPFKIQLIIKGSFDVDESIDIGERNFHLTTSAPSMLYGIARTLVSEATGRTPDGSFMLPSVTFSEIAEEKWGDEDGEPDKEVSEN